MQLTVHFHSPVIAAAQVTVPTLDLDSAQVAAESDPSKRCQIDEGIQVPRVPRLQDSENHGSLYGSCPVKSAGLKSIPPNSTGGPPRIEPYQGRVAHALPLLRKEWN